MKETRNFQIELQLIGATTRQKMITKCSGHNCKFEYSKELEEVPVLVFKSEGENYYGEYFTITLWETEGECGSGWTTAAWGCYEIKREKVPFDEVPIGEYSKIKIFTTDWEHFSLRDEDEDEDENEDEYEDDYENISNDIFTISEYGDDHYYPRGWAAVKAKFKPLARRMAEQPVWIFTGPSATGKSSLAHETSREVYETDSNSNLPNDLNNYEIIVVGGKYKFSIDDIKNKITNKKVIVVNFD